MPALVVTLALCTIVAGCVRAEELPRTIRHVLPRFIFACPLLNNVFLASFQNALYWYKKGAEQGHLDSIVNLAFMFELGKGVEKDKERALELFSQAVLLGDVGAQAEIDRLKSSKKQTGREGSQEFESECSSESDSSPHVSLRHKCVLENPEHVASCVTS